MEPGEGQDLFTSNNIPHSLIVRLQPIVKIVNACPSLSKTGREEEPHHAVKDIKGAEVRNGTNDDRVSAVDIMSHNTAGCRNDREVRRCDDVSHG